LCAVVVSISVPIAFNNDFNIFISTLNRIVLYSAFPDWFITTATFATMVIVFTFLCLTEVKWFLKGVQLVAMTSAYSASLQKIKSTSEGFPVFSQIQIQMRMFNNVFGSVLIATKYFLIWFISSATAICMNRKFESVYFVLNIQNVFIAWAILAMIKRGERIFDYSSSCLEQWKKVHAWKKVRKVGFGKVVTKFWKTKLKSLQAIGITGPLELYIEPGESIRILGALITNTITFLVLFRQLL